MAPGRGRSASITPTRPSTARSSRTSRRSSIRSRPTTIAGLYGGKLTAAGRTITLSSYSDARGVTLSGKVTLKKFGPPLVFQGAITVGGTAAAHGLVGLSGASLAGTLGGRAVR